MHAAVTIGLNAGKNVFQAHGYECQGRCRIPQGVSREVTQILDLDRKSSRRQNVEPRA